MSVQTNYSETLASAVAGAQATMAPATILSRNVEDTTIGFGQPVAQGAADKGVVLASAAATDIIGITLVDRSADSDLFEVGDSARVMAEGDVWVEASVAVAAGDAVYVVPATAAFTNVATSNTAVNGARFDTSTTAAGQLAVIRLS